MALSTNPIYKYLTVISFGNDGGRCSSRRRNLMQRKHQIIDSFSYFYDISMWSSEREVQFESSHMLTTSCDGFPGQKYSTIWISSPSWFPVAWMINYSRLLRVTGRTVRHNTHWYLILMPLHSPPFQSAIRQALPLWLRLHWANQRQLVAKAQDEA